MKNWIFDRFYFYSILLIALTSCSAYQIVSLEEPKHDKDENYIKHFAYTLSYNEKTEQADWVAYELKAEELIPVVTRSDNFKPDPLVKSGTANNTDYKASGFDRGHLAPAADMLCDEKAMEESFYYSNISPQHPSLNRGKWRSLEEMVRQWAIEFGTVYIVSGPLFMDSIKYIGNNQVAIPSHFYKAVLVYTKQYKQSIGFILPNEKCSEDIFKYAVTVDSIEIISGFDLYYKLDTKIESIVESNFDLYQW